MLSIAGHKVYAPKGIGALYVRKGVTLPPLLVGAGQEHGRRPGTENVAYSVGLGEACRLARTALEKSPQIGAVADHLLRQLEQAVPGIVLVGHPTERLPNTLNVLFPGVSGRRLLQICPDVLASNGSACHADNEEPSAILLALGIPPDQALGTVRLSVGRTTTIEDATTAAARLAEGWRSLQQSEPVRVLRRARR
jgi:cysteine desulfurase